MQTVQHLLFTIVATLVQLLPLRTVRMFARVLASFSYSVVRIRRDLTQMQLRRAFPEWSDDEVRRATRASYINLVTVILELMWTPRLRTAPLGSILRLRNPEVLQHAIARGRGVVLMSGHFGNWEWLSIGVAHLLDLSFTVIVHPMHNAQVDVLVERWRTMLGNRVVPMGLSIREIVRTLRSRGTVALLADQSGPSNAIYTPFFGRLAATYEGPASFALKTGAPVLMGFAVRADDGNYDVHIEEISTADLPDASEQSIRRLTLRHVRKLEEVVRAHPDQWLWQHKRWKHAPDADARIITEE
jgi:Kdo2-lipid IVA lauroyltransferase/acyltransferase